MKLPLATPLLALLPLVLVSCYHHEDHIVVVDRPRADSLYEREPNDTALTADWIGELRPGDYVEIGGHITECCPDPYDGFAFYAPGPVELHVALYELDLDADLDFCIYDPTLDEMIACWETDLHPEAGVFAFEGPGELHVVVRSYLGDTNYVLALDAQPLPPGLAAHADAALASAPSADARREFEAYRAVAAIPAADAPRRVELLVDGGAEPVRLTGTLTR
ncbi:MAG: hypothetical protein H6828_09695 [Planctomycetes bacterium]|nr:hypothetical protein [Planctomycetota bacterium]